MKKFSFILFVSILLLVVFLCYQGAKLEKKRNFKKAEHDIILLLKKTEKAHIRSLERHSTDFIKTVEGGFKDKCYKDANGTFAIGFGTQVNEATCNKLGMIDEAAATVLMEEHTEKIFKILRELGVKDRNKHKSLSSFAYNIGYDNFKKSKVYLAIKRNDWKMVKKEMLEWGFRDEKYRAGGSKRRMEEINLI